MNGVSGITVPSGFSVPTVDDGFLSDAGIAALNSGGESAVPFAGVLQSMMQQANELEHEAGQKMTGLLNGSGVEIHDAMIAMQKAGLASELTMQVRNKAVGAYQQMWGMQI